MTIPSVDQPGSLPERPGASGPETSALSLPGAGSDADTSSLMGDTVSLRAIRFADPGDGAQPRLSPAAQAAVAALPPGSALLVVHQGAGVGARFLLDADTVTAGRHPKQDILLDDSTVSRNHAEFRREGLGYAVRDKGSLNGMYVNGDRADAAVLRAGDEIQIGKFRLVYHPSPNAPSEFTPQPAGTAAPVPTTADGAASLWPGRAAGDGAEAAPARVSFLRRWFSRGSGRRAHRG